MLTVLSINGNTRKAPFWILSYVLFNADLIAIIRAETAPAIDETSKSINLAHLLSTETCPQLNSIWEETVRLTAFAASVRFLT